jgi:exosortase/archaeosortase family protein
MLYLGLVTVISVLLVFVPNYFLLQIFTAENSVRILRSMGYPADVQLRGIYVLVNGFDLSRECTGVQGLMPISVFFGLMPGIRSTSRILVVSTAALSIYAMNLARIVIELAMYSRQLLPWFVIHDYFGFGFSVVSVVIVFFLVGRIISLNSLADLVKVLSY